jgi:hypothetical protein
MRPTILIVLSMLFPAAFLAQDAGSIPKQPPKTYSIPLPPKTDFSAFDWLLGEWAGKTVPKSPQGDVHLSVSPDLDGRVLILREKISLAATDSTPAGDESWMGVLSPGTPGGDFMLRVYSSTGFATRYRVTVHKAEIRFLPEGGEAPPPGWLFRRVIARAAPGELTDTVEAAPPEGAFFQYYSARLTRVDASKAAATAEKPAAAPAAASDKPH